MIPNNNKCLKQQEDSRAKILKESDMRLPQMSMPEYCPHLQNSIEIMENYIKNQIDLHESHNFMGMQPEQCFYDPNFPIKNNWCMNNNNYYEEFYNYKIKREEYDEHKDWPPQIKDEESPSANHDQGFQAYQMPKQEEFQYAPRCTFQDPNKFLGPIVNSREEKNNRRKLKVQAYLRKKSMRSFEKKIIYKCRKQVADNRIRFRGRFISQAQAASILKLDSKQNYTATEIMEKLKACHVQLPKQDKPDKPVKQERRDHHHSNLQVHPMVVEFSMVKKCEEDQ